MNVTGCAFPSSSSLLLFFCLASSFYFCFLFFTDDFLAPLVGPNTCNAFEMQITNDRLRTPLLTTNDEHRDYDGLGISQRSYLHGCVCMCIPIYIGSIRVSYLSMLSGPPVARASITRHPPEKQIPPFARPHTISSPLLHPFNPSCTYMNVIDTAASFPVRSMHSICLPLPNSPPNRLIHACASPSRSRARGPCSRTWCGCGRTGL